MKGKNNTESKKKILHIVEAMGGGIFTYLVNLANGTCDRFDVTIAYGVREETPEDIEGYFDDKVTLIRVENFSRSLNPGKDISAAREIKKIAEKVCPDIIHMHSSKAGAIGRMVFSSKKYRLFYTPHGYSFLMEDFSKVKKHLFYCIEKICGLKNCMTVACGMGEYEESRKVTKHSVHISNGVDMKEIDRLLGNSSGQAEKSGAGNSKDIDGSRDKNTFTVYTTGRISYQKNPEMFNQVAKLLPEISFVWIGDGDMRDMLDGSNIQITGWLERGEALRCADRGDVFFLPSRWEGLPISILEAMYMKKPCVVSNISGNRYVIRNGETGYLCDSAREYAQVIRKLQTKKDEDIINCAHEKILNHYNVEKIGERYTRLYMGEQ